MDRVGFTVWSFGRRVKVRQCFKGAKYDRRKPGYRRMMIVKVRVSFVFTKHVAVPAMPDLDMDVYFSLAVLLRPQT